MDHDQITKKIQTVMMEFASSLDSGSAAIDDLVKRMMNIVNEVEASGVPLSDEIQQSIDQIYDMASLTESVTQGSFFTLEPTESIPGVPAGLNFGLPSDQPEIFNAIEDGDTTLVKQALGTWDVNATHGQFEKTALYATMSNMFGVSVEIADLLLDAGADPKKGLTDSNVLHGLGFGRCDEVPVEELAGLVKRCVGLGADIEQRTNNLQWTPLHTALNEWNAQASEALLLGGADPNACAGLTGQGYNAGQSGLQMSIMNSVIFELLLRYGADPYARDANGQTAASALGRNLASAKPGDFRDSLERCHEALQRHG